jgi:hypothetical protein
MGLTEDKEKVHVREAAVRAASSTAACLHLYHRQERQVGARYTHRDCIQVPAVLAAAAAAADDHHVPVVWYRRWLGLRPVACSSSQSIFTTLGTSSVRSDGGARVAAVTIARLIALIHGKRCCKSRPYPRRRPSSLRVTTSAT